MMTETALRSSGLQATRTRDPFWDAARFVAIVLVVVGHTIEVHRDADAMYALYLLIYAFHMPLFALVAGYFSKAEPITVSTGRSLAQRLIVPYLVFTFLWLGFQSWLGQGFRVDLASPYWHLWFLTSLVMWRLALPIVASFRWPVALSAVVAVAAGLMPAVGYQLDLSRTLTFLPFFVAGWAIRERNVWPRWSRVLAILPIRVLAATILVGSGVIAYWRVDDARRLNLRVWTQADRSFEALETGLGDGAILRFSLLILAAVLIAAVLALVPRDNHTWARWGSATMYPYLFHLVVIVGLQQIPGFTDWFDTLWKYAALVAGAVTLTVLLSTKPVRVGTRWLVEPTLPWLFPDRPSKVN